MVENLLWRLFLYVIFSLSFIILAIFLERKWLKWACYTVAAAPWIKSLVLLVMFWNDGLIGQKEISKIKNSTEKARVNIILIIVDGARADVYTKANAQNILDLQKSGAYTFEAQTVLPSLTATAHISLGTGLGPQKHGITTNGVDIDDNESLEKVWPAVQKFRRAEIKTILDYCKAAGLKTIVVIESSSKLNLKIVQFFVRNLDKLETVDEKSGADTLLTKATTFLDDQGYICLNIHLPDVDRAGHQFGWMTREQIDAVKKVDAAFKKFLSALKNSSKKDNSYVIFTSDHGGHDKTHGTNTKDDMTIPWFISGPATKIKQGHKIMGVMDNHEKRPLIIYDTAATILHILGIDVPKEMDGKPALDAFGESNELTHQPR